MPQFSWWLAPAFTGIGKFFILACLAHAASWCSTYPKSQLNLGLKGNRHVTSENLLFTNYYLVIAKYVTNSLILRKTHIFLLYMCNTCICVSYICGKFGIVNTLMRFLLYILLHCYIITFFSTFNFHVRVYFFIYLMHTVGYHQQWPVTIT